MGQMPEGRVEAVLLGLDAHTLVSTPVSQVQAAFEGLDGDKHAGLTRHSDGRTPNYARGTIIRNDRQVSLVSIEELAEIAALLDIPEILAEWLGANILTSGIPALTHLPPATRLFFSQGTVLYVTDENLPCRGPARVIQAQYAETAGIESGFVKAALHRRGLVAVVEKPGLICAGDQIRAALPG